MITIIIPTYQEIQNIDVIQNELDHLEGDFEVIFSDGFSTDGTYEKIRYPKIQETKFRSNQMNAAADYAKGDVLWFVHADSLLDPKSILQIENCGWDVGCFKIKFQSTNKLMKGIAFLSTKRVQFRNIAFGDQGIFIKRSLFEDIGRYKPLPLMEDYQLSMDLKKKGKKIRVLETIIETSARKFEQEGILRTVLKMQKLQYQYRRKKDIDQIAKDYGE